MAGGSKPGSSRRCDECKKRRKKCDLQEPHCLRCRQSGLRCSGPSRLGVFVNRQANSFRAQTPREALSQAYQSRSVRDGRSQEFYQITATHVRRLQAVLAEHQLKSSLASNRVILSARSTEPDSCYQALLEEFRPGHGSNGAFSGDRVPVAAWRHYSSVAACIRALLPLATIHAPVLDHSIFTLLALYYGRLHGDPGLVLLSRSSYAVSLSHYYDHLGRFMSEKDQNLVSCQIFLCSSIALQLFEHLNEVDVMGYGYLAHFDGAMKLFRICGPRSLHDSPAVRMAFMGLRGIAVFVDIHRRRPSFLSEPEWLELPFEGVEKSSRDSLLELGLEIPNLLKSADELQSDYQALRLNSAQLNDLALMLLSKFDCLQKRFDGWQVKLRATVSGPLYWSRSQPIVQYLDFQDLECGPKYTNSFHQLLFPCGPLAGLLVNSWSFQLEMLMTTIDLQQTLLDTSNPSLVQVASKSLVKSRIEAEDTAQLILEAEPYLSSCFEGLICLQSPLKIVEKYFSRSTKS